MLSDKQYYQRIRYIVISVTSCTVDRGLHRDAGSSLARSRATKIPDRVRLTACLPRDFLGGEGLAEASLVLGGEVRLDDLELVVRELFFDALEVGVSGE